MEIYAPYVPYNGNETVAVWTYIPRPMKMKKSKVVHKTLFIYTICTFSHFVFSNLFVSCLISLFWCVLLLNLTNMQLHNGCSVLNTVRSY